MSSEDIVIVGAGFAGYHAARRLAKRLRGTARITVLNPTDYFLYLPLLPEVAGGVLEPRQVTVPLADTLPGVRVVLGQATGVDLAQRRVVYRNPEGRDGELRYDRLLLTVGSVNANLRHYQLAAQALAQADLGWLRQLIARRIALERFADALTVRPDDIKVVLTLTGQGR